MKSGKNRLLAVVTAGVLILVGTAGCSGGSEPVSKTEINQAVDVKVFSVANGSKASGKIAPSEEVQVVSKIAGKVASVAVQEGAKVEKGQLLVELDSIDFALQVQQAQAGLAAAQAKLADVQSGARPQELQQLESVLEQAKAAYDVAKSNYERASIQYNSGAVPKAALDDAGLKMESAKSAYEQAKAKLDLAREGATANTIRALQAGVSQAQASLELARNSLNNTRITAPISGVVSAKNIDPGEMASPGVPLLTIVNLDSVNVEASVPESFVSQIKLGDSVDVKVSSLGDKTFTGTVSFISPVSDKNSNTFPLKVKLANPDGVLKAGMVAELSFRTDGGKQIEIPTSTVVRRDGNTYVFKVNGDHVQKVEVTGKLKDENWFVADSGIQDSDKLVIHPADDLQDGAKVKVALGESK